MNIVVQETVRPLLPNKNKENLPNSNWEHPQHPIGAISLKIDKPKGSRVLEAGSFLCCYRTPLFFFFVAAGIKRTCESSIETDLRMLIRDKSINGLRFSP